MRSKPNPTAPDATTDAALEERRSGQRSQAAGNPLKRLKGALSRPVKVEWRNGQPQVVLVERRKGPRLDRTQAHMCSELGARLLTQGVDETSKLLRCLVIVHDKLSRKGWEGVGALPAAVLAKAIMQAEMLAAEEPSPALTQLATQLGGLHTSAVAREEAAKAERGFDAQARVEVRETSFNEFEEAERSWTRTMPSDLAPLYKDA